MEHEPREGIPLLGEKVPEMEVQTTHGRMKIPTDLSGKWFVLFSHPGDFTPVCTTEFIAFEKMTQSRQGPPDLRQEQGGTPGQLAEERPPRRRGHYTPALRRKDRKGEAFKVPVLRLVVLPQEAGMKASFRFFLTFSPQFHPMVYIIMR